MKLNFAIIAPACIHYYLESNYSKAYNNNDNNRSLLRCQQHIQCIQKILFEEEFRINLVLDYTGWTIYVYYGK